MFFGVCLDVQVHRGGCRPGSNVHMEVDSHPRIPLFVYFLIQHPIGVPGCVVCSLHARLRSSCTCGKSLSYLFAFTWTYGCIGVAAGQVLMYIRRSILAPEFHFLFFLDSAPNRRACLRGLLVKRKSYAHPVHVAGRYRMYLRLLGRTGASGWLPARF